MQMTPFGFYGCRHLLSLRAAGGLDARSPPGWKRRPPVWLLLQLPVVRLSGRNVRGLAGRAGWELAHQGPAALAGGQSPRLKTRRKLEQAAGRKGMKLSGQVSVHTDVCTCEGLRKVQSQKCIQANPPGHAEEVIMPPIYPKGDFPVMSWGKKTPCCYCFMAIELKKC